MKSDLAERLLAKLMDWDVPRFTLEVAKLQTLATLKYDAYGGYGPGVKFAENLARWLDQFDPVERETAFDFVMRHLVFVSELEFTHLISVSYKDHLEIEFLDRAASDLRTDIVHRREIFESVEFQALRRRALFLGLSDGSRLDKLRRASGLSHEQFFQDYSMSDETVKSAQDALAEALLAQSLPGDATFRSVVLVDDFSGSGKTLLRDDLGEIRGKLKKIGERLESLNSHGFVSDDLRCYLLLYVASYQAVAHVESLFSELNIRLKILVVQRIEMEHRVDVANPEMDALCRTYYDPDSSDVHKKDTPIGYDDCALPLVLEHNTPNNSVCLLWAETEELGRRGLFPRYERHHKDRP